MAETRREFLGELGRYGLAAGSFLLGLNNCSGTLNQGRALHSDVPDSTDGIPTVELHRHLEAGMSPETIAYLAQRNKITEAISRNGKARIENVNLQDPDSIRGYYKEVLTSLTRPDGFVKFLDSLGVPLSVIKTLDDLKYLTRVQCLEQARSGSLHTEFRGSPYTYQEMIGGGVSMVDVINAIRDGLDEVFQEEGASGTFIACISRQKADQFGQQVIDAVLKTHSPKSPVGLDLAGGPEGKFPPAMFEKLFAPAWEANVPITVHAGEQSKGPDYKDAPPAFVRDAVEKLGARRIGHGTSLIADVDLQGLLRDRGTAIEVCPPSNVALGYVPSMREHPLRKFLNRGLNVTVNTDDPLGFGTMSVRDIFRQYGTDLGLTSDDKVRLVRNGLSAAFVVPQRRSLLEARLQASCLKLRHRS